MDEDIMKALYTRENLGTSKVLQNLILTGVQG